MSYQYRYKSWNWNKTFTGLFQISLLVFGFSIVFQNLSFLNSIHPYIPAGLLMEIILGIAIIDHFYKVVKWYLAWTKYSYDNHKRIGNIIIHLCLYLIVIAIALSIPINFNSVQNIEKHNSDDLYKYIETGLNNNIPEPEKQPVSVSTNYSPQILGANDNERKYIENILNNTKKDVRNKIISINVVSDAEIINKCGYDAAGCAYNEGLIYIVSLSFWLNPHLVQDEYIESGAGYIRCSTFAWTLNHEIGHIKGFMIGDESEVFAENYAYDHTMVNLVYEPGKKC